MVTHGGGFAIALNNLDAAARICLTILEDICEAILLSLYCAL